jgi:xylulose-5-phosphate/fructose-6-phosphate phosphoketolase
MITRTNKIKKGARNAARSDRGAAKSTVKRALRTPKKAVSNDGETFAHGTARSTIKGAPLSRDELNKIDAYWRAANYLSVGQIYLYDNPLLKKPLKKEHVKPRLLGHWGTTPGLNFIYAHLNRVIKQRDLNMIYIIGPGHGGPGIVGNAYMEGTYSEVYPNIAQDEEGMKRLFTQFSFPGGIPSHVAPETPGSIHEGGELGYAISHAYGAAYDNPNLIVACVVGDGEAETGPMATSWHSNKFLNPISDGVVLPILHLNGYKIANPCVLARISHNELDQLFRGYGYTPYFVEGSDPEKMHQLMASTLDNILEDINRIKADASRNGVMKRPLWPMIILRSPKGWTCPKEIDGKRTEGYWRSHQVPMGEMHEKPAHIKILEKWMKSYKPEELFDETGRLKPELAELPPKGNRRMSANPHANGGLLLRDLRLPDFCDYAVNVTKPGAVTAESTRVMGKFLRDTMKLNMESRNFRLFSPDENNSNRWQDAMEVTNRAWMAERYPYDDHLAPDGRVMEMLSEHQCQGWLEGYLLTGRHGFFSCYEAFIHIIDSMFNQHAKWLKVCHEIPWRRPIGSLNYLLSSHVWRQDHNGFSHQDPGFIDHVVNKKAEVVRVYLPPDANTLLSVTDHCLRSRNYVNVVVAGKQPAPQWLTMDQAVKHCTAGIGIWEWASNDKGAEPDVVMACCGDVPTLETLAAVDLFRQHLPALKIRVINVVNLMKLQPQSEHPHGLSDPDFDALFTKDKPIVFAFHGYPWLIHRLTYRRTNHKNLHVRGYKEEGTTSTPFDMVVRNDLDRFHLVGDVIDRLPQLGSRAAYAKQAISDKLLEHKQYIAKYGDDMPEITDWQWGQASAGTQRTSSTEGDNV